MKDHTFDLKSKKENWRKYFEAKKNMIADPTNQSYLVRLLLSLLEVGSN